LGAIQPRIWWVPRFLPGGKAAEANPTKRRGKRKSSTIPLLPLWSLMVYSRANLTLQKNRRPTQFREFVQWKRATIVNLMLIYGDSVLNGIICLQVTDGEDYLHLYRLHTNVLKKRDVGSR
jgi:hypothetical protein